MEFDVAYLNAQWPALMRGLWLTVQVSALSIVLSILVGVLGAAARVLQVPVLGKLVVGYVEFIRNTPLLAQLFFIFYGLPGLGLRLSLFWSGVLCLTVWAGAYQIENVRGGLETVGKGLREAAFSLGLSPWRFFRLVAAPMAIRVGLPSMLNTSISLLKNSSYLQAIGLAELTYVAIDRISMDFRTIEMFAAICVIYLLLVLTLSFFASRLEYRLNAPFRL
ncbi:amino acid ABC transporter permease [Bosea sp. Root670]|jgi:polar amino acid transport system permease protein|uniref:Polar amino acid transport system permease protein n=1 Tax=Bosea robiniae TaxID=1036780 RepID=A0ABY0P185_9HYPH|nr:MULTISPECIES: amino acid ABC transporter permease [Bosea]KRE03111.1 amino acid ABC transporter permease [Bosea sp. Root670]SDG71338.1 polar amino acid transport system permease protein [Bosea robiniae]